MRLLLLGLILVLGIVNHSNLSGRLILTGLGLDAMPYVANGFQMPSSNFTGVQDGIRYISIYTEPKPNLWVLGDILTIPLYGKQELTFSLGDFVALLGLLKLVK